MTNHLPMVFFALFAFLPLSFAEQPKVPVVFVWETGTNTVPPDAFFTIGSGVKVHHRVGPAGEQIQAYQISEDRIEPEYLPADHWGEPAYGFRLSLRMDNLKIPLGSPVSASVVFRNITSKMLSIDVGMANQDYQFVVIDHQKQLVPLTDYGKGLLKRRQATGGGMPALHPRTQFKLNFRIDLIYDFREKGEYVVYAKRKITMLDDKNPDGYLHSDVVSGTAIIQIVDPAKTSGQANPGNTVTTTSPATASLANSGTPSVIGKPPSANSLPSASAAAPQPAARTPKNILQPTPKAAANKTPAKLAQAETGGGWSSRDWVFGLLVLGVVLGLGWYLFRARSPHPKS